MTTPNRQNEKCANKCRPDSEKETQGQGPELVELVNRLKIEIQDLKYSNQKLTTGVETYRLLYEEAPVGYQSLDEDGNILEVNKAWLDTLGYSKEEVIGKRFRDFVDPRRQDKFVECFSAFKSVGEVQDSELDMLKKDGSGITLAFSGKVVRESDGRFKRTHCLIQDVTEKKRTEDQLKETQRQQKAILDNIPDIAWIKDKESRFIIVNEAFGKACGLAPEELKGKTDLDVWPPELAEQYRTDDKKVMSTGARKLIQELLKEKSGQTKWIETIKTPIYDASGETVGTTGIARDITERKEAELRTIEQNRFLTNVMDAIIHPFYVIDAKDHTILMANSAAKRAFSGSGSKCYELTHNRRKQCDSQTGHPCPIEEIKKIKTSATVEHIHCDNSGQSRNVEIHAYPIFDRHGNVEKLIEYAIDITERKQAEEERDLLATVVQQTTESTVIIDANFRIRYVNPAFQKKSGYSYQQLIGADPELWRSEEHDDAFFEDLRKVVSQGKTWKGRIVAKGKDGNLFQEDVTICPVRNLDGAITHFVGIGHDVTRQVELENQLMRSQKMEALGTLAGGIAHDFNNLLTITAGYSELLLQTKKKTDPEYDDLQKIATASNRGTDLVQRLMAFSRKSDTKFRPINLSNVIRDVSKLLLSTIPKMIGIKMDLSDHLMTIDGDSGQIEQILMNLALNACAAMPSGGDLLFQTKNVFIDEIYAQNHLDLRPGNYVSVIISDTGIGMDKKTLERIFEPFFTTKALGEGTGLGLAMVYGIVKSHGGQITCYSEPHRGTVFKIYFPTVETEEESDPKSLQPFPKGGNETILFVDDEAFIRDLGKQILEEVGYSVIIVDDGLQALEIYRQSGSQIALVILDVIMPKMGGKQCLESLLQINPGVKAIMASAYSTTTEKNEFVGLGAKGLVDKPFSFRNLLEIVRSVLDG